MNTVTNNKEIITCLNKIENVEDISTEFEVRFGQFINERQKFSPGITLENFIDIQKYIHSLTSLDKLEYSFTAIHKDGTRVTQILKNPVKSYLAFPWETKITGEKIITKKKYKNY